MSMLRDLLREIHHRSLWQVLGVYALASWVVYQVVLALMEGLGLPGWVTPTALILLLLGLPLVLATAIIQEGGPKRSQREQDALATLAGLELAGTEQPDADEEAGAAEARDTGSPAAGASPVARLFTWNRAVTSGVLAFAALGIAATGFMGMRALGIGPAATLVTAGVLEEADPVVLADFENATPDSTLGVTVTEALRIDLERSEVLRLVSREALRNALERMERDPEAPVTQAIAREIAQRDGYKALIEGEVRELGGQYLLGARVVAADGEVLASFRERANSQGEVIDAIDRLSNGIREKVGESLRSIRAEDPLPDVTTSSLAALRQAAEGMRVFGRRGDQLAALRHLEAAIQEDSAFAMAWMSLGIILDNLGIETDRQLRAMTRAYELRDRLPEKERRFLAAAYHTDMGEIDRAIDAYEAFLAIDSTSEWAAGAFNNLALLYRQRRNHDHAADLFRRAVDARSGAELFGNTLQYSNLVIELMYAERIDEARATLAEALEYHPDHRRMHSRRIDFAGVDGDYAAVDSLSLEHLERYGDSVEGRSKGQFSLAYTAGVRGRLKETSNRYAELERWATSEGWAGAALSWAAGRALITGVAFQNFRRSVSELDAALERHGIHELPPDDVPWDYLAYVYARLGALDRAREMLDTYRREIPEARREAGGSNAANADALIAMTEGRLDDADAALDVADRRNYCDFCRLPLRGMLAEQRGQQDAAIAAYEEYLETPWLLRLDDDVQHRAFVIQRLADLHEQQGRPAEAARYHAQFVELWRDADPELQPRVDAARRALERLTRERAAG